MRDCHSPGLGGMLELNVAPFLGDRVPAVRFQRRNHVPAFHRVYRYTLLTPPSTLMLRAGSRHPVAPLPAPPKVGGPALAARWSLTFQEVPASGPFKPKADSAEDHAQRQGKCECVISDLLDTERQAELLQSLRPEI